MNTISSSSSYTATSASSHGLSSLASGIDTESMVESMLSGIQSKIDKAQGDKTVLGWKQDMYRDIIKDMNEFHDKYFNILSENCVLSNAFYNAMKAVSSSGAVNVTADSTASTGKTSIEVGQLATATSIKSSSAVSGVLSGRIDAYALKKREVVLNVGGTDYKVDLSAVETKTTDADKKQAILDAFNSAGAGNDIASYDAEGKLVLNTNDEKKEIKVSGESSAWGLATTGLAAYSSSYKGKLTTAEEVDPDKKPSFTVSLDGVKKTITIDPNKIDLTNPTNPDYSDLETDIKSQLKAAFGNGVKKFEIKDGLMTFEAGAGREIVLGGDSDVLKNIGFVAGQSNRIARGQTLKEAAFGTPLEGNYFAININGVDLEFSGDETISQMMSKINNSDAGVRISYNNFEDQFVMESTSTGEGYDITMSQTSGNLLNALFGKNNFDTGNSVGSGLAGNVSLKGGDVSSELFADGSEKEIDLSSTNGEFRLNVNGKDYVFTIKKDSEDENDDGKYTPKELVKKINEQLKKQFGAGEIELEWDDTNHDATIKVASNQAVKFGGITAKSSSAKDLADMLGFKKGANNYINASSNLADIKLENLGFKNTAGTTLADLQTRINGVGNAELTIKDGRLHLTAKNSGTDVYDGLTGSDKFMLASVFGSNGVTNDGGSFTPALTLGTTATGIAAKTEGQNAIVKINGVETERSTNIFKTNGIQFELTDTTATKDASGNIVWDSSKAAKVDTSRDTDKMFDTIKGLVADYNKIVEKLNGKVKEDADYKDYPPLTDAQKKEMSESEVKLWNEKAQKGLLRNDSDVSTLLSSMRMAFYNKPAGSSISIWDLGIETTDDYKSGGKLTLNESTLKQMLQSNPDDIRELFFNGTDGIFDQLSTSIKASTNTSFGSRGTLVALAGYGGTASDKSNTIYNRMRELDDKVKTLKKTYEKQKTRYWNQFNSMEKMIANMNSQSSWLAQQFA